jgi:hypothetical protein
MGFRVRQIDAESKFCDQLTMTALAHALPMATVEAVLRQHGPRALRHRKLSMPVVVWVIIAMHLYTHLAIRDLLGQLAHGLRFIWPALDLTLPTSTALTCRRYQLGPRPLVALFHSCCRPLATPQTPGAFLFGLRLMALDGTVENLPDTPDNARVFGRHTTDRGDGPSHRYWRSTSASAAPTPSWTRASGLVIPVSGWEPSACFVRWVRGCS